MSSKAEREEYTKKFSILTDSAIEILNAKTGALVFRHVIGWMGEEEHLEAAFVNPSHARAFASAMESEEERWTVVTVYSDLSSATSVRMGEAEVFHGGHPVKRVRFL